MNSFATENLPYIQALSSLRDQMLDLLTDADLAYKLPGANLSLGEVLHNRGNVQASYTESFHSFVQDFKMDHAPSDVGGSVAALRAWYKATDERLEAAISGYSEEDAQSRVIRRESGYEAAVALQFEFYSQALFIFLGKESIYLRALDKPLTKEWIEYVG